MPLACVLAMGGFCATHQLLHQHGHSLPGLPAGFACLEEKGQQGGLVAQTQVSGTFLLACQWRGEHSSPHEDPAPG